jgi:Ca2+-transporting ATPase
MVDAVEEGRLVRANVQRVLHYLLSTNGSEIWVVAGAVALGLPSPLTPLQLLWLNLVTDLAPGLALALEPRDPELMQQPPRDPKESIVPRKMLVRILAESAAIAGGALAAYGLGIMRHGIGPAAQTMAFASLLGSQLLHVGWARAGERPALSGSRGRKNPYLAPAMGLSIAFQAAALFVPPLRTALGGAPLALADFGIALAGAALPSIAIEVSRFLGRHEQKALPAPAAPVPGGRTDAIAREHAPTAAETEPAQSVPPAASAEKPEMPPPTAKKAPARRAARRATSPAPGGVR